MSGFAGVRIESRDRQPWPRKREVLAQTERGLANGRGQSVDAEAGSHLGLGHAHDAIDEARIVGKLRGVDRFLRFGEGADRLLGGEDAPLRRLILAALAGDQTEDQQQRDRARHRAAHLNRMLLARKSGNQPAWAGLPAPPPGGRASDGDGADPPSVERVE